jgi:hypothetical protein
MKKLFFIFGYIFVLNLSSCFSQLLENNKKEFKSDTRVVYGYSNDINALDLGITFGKVINSVDTTYYIKFQLYAPNSDFRQDILINKTSTITFLSKSGKAVDLKLTDVISFTENVKQIDNPYSSVKSHYSTILILNVTKERLIEIGSEPFYKLILPYFNASSKVENKAIFVKPTLFTRRIFIQKSVNYILDIY